MNTSARGSASRRRRTGRPAWSRAPPRRRPARSPARSGRAGGARRDRPRHGGPVAGVRRRDDQWPSDPCVERHETDDPCQPVEQHQDADRDDQQPPITWTARPWRISGRRVAARGRRTRRRAGTGSPAPACSRSAAGAWKRASRRGRHRGSSPGIGPMHGVQPIANTAPSPNAAASPVRPPTMRLPARPPTPVPPPARREPAGAGGQARRGAGIERSPGTLEHGDLQQPGHAQPEHDQQDPADLPARSSSATARLPRTSRSRRGS